MSRLIWIYTVCHSVLSFVMTTNFATTDISKFKDGSVQLKTYGERVNQQYTYVYPTWQADQSLRAPFYD